MQSFALPSAGRQARRRSANCVLVGCLSFLCFVTWALSRFETPSPISTESLHHQAPARAAVFELYWYFRDSLARNESFYALAGPVHRTRRSLLEYSETAASTRQEIFDEEEQEEQPFDKGFGDDLSLEFVSLKKRTGCNNDRDPRTCSRGVSSSTQVASSSAQGSSSSTCAADPKIWPVFGGHRENDQEM